MVRWSRGTSRHELRIRGDGGASVCGVIKPASTAPSLPTAFHPRQLPAANMAAAN